MRICVRKCSNLGGPAALKCNLTPVLRWCIAMQCQSISPTALSVCKRVLIYILPPIMLENPIEKGWFRSYGLRASSDLCVKTYQRRSVPSSSLRLSTYNVWSELLRIYPAPPSSTVRQCRDAEANVLYIFHRSHEHATLLVGRSDNGMVLFRTLSNFLNRKGDLLLHLLWSHCSSSPHIDGNLRAKYG